MSSLSFDTMLPNAGASRRNSTKACTRCRANHVRCDGRIPSKACPEGNVCTYCVKAAQDCIWDTRPDKRLAPSRQEFEQLTVRVKIQDCQIAILQERLRALGAPDDLPDDIEESDGYGSDAVKELGYGFGRLVLEENNIMYYGDSSPFADLGAPMSMKPRLPAIEGFQHSTSRMYEIKPMHDLKGPELDPNSTKWDMFLPRGEDGSQLITRHQHDRALELYFRFSTSWTLRIIPNFFLRDLAIATEAPDPKPQINHYSPMLHNIVVAVALAYSDDRALRERALRDKFISQGKLSLDSECQRPTLSTVQSLDLLSSYYSGMGEQTLGFLHFGMAIRMGQALGLHVRIPDGKVANDDRIERNWVYWNIFIRDKTWSLYVGRNQGLPTTQVEMRDPPLDFRMDEEDWIWHAPDGRVICQKAYLSSTFAEVVKLSLIASHIMTAVYDEHLASKLRWKLAQINKIWLNLRKWRERLRKELIIYNPATAMEPAHIFQLNLVYEWMILLLLRPFYEPHLQKLAISASDGTGTDPNFFKDNEDLKKIYRLANEECPRSAGRVLDLFRAYDKLFTLRLSPLTNVQIAYHAGKTLMRIVIAGGCSRTKAIQAGHKARKKVEECAGLLRAIGETWPSGAVTAQMLEKDLGTEIEKQNKASASFSRFPKEGIVPAPNPMASNATRPKSSPTAIPMWLMSPDDCLGADNAPGTSSGQLNATRYTNRKRRPSPSRTEPHPKRSVPCARRNESRRRDLLAQASYTCIPVSIMNEQVCSQVSAASTTNFNLDISVTDHSLLFPIASPTSPQVYYEPPPCTSALSPSSQHADTNDLLSVPLNFFTEVEMHTGTSMNQWLPSGNTFPGAPSFETPVLPWNLPFCADSDNMDDYAGDVEIFSSGTFHSMPGGEWPVRASRMSHE